MKVDQRMLVSILSVSFNSEATIAKTIESVLAQTYENLEYIIIDGASTDKTVEIAETYRSQFEAKKINYFIVSEPDRGMYDGLNKGARLSKGELVGQINSDDWYEPDAVKTMVELYETEKYDVAWASIRIKRRTGDLIKHAKIGLFWTTTHWCHPAMFSRREILLEYPYSLESMYDDFDYITTVRQAGKKIVTIDHIICNFSFGKGGQSTKQGLKEAKRRVDITYSIYKKHGMSKIYWFHRWMVEIFKVLLS